MATTLWVTIGALALAQAGDVREPSKASTRNESIDRTLEQQVQPTLKAFESAWNQHDPKAMASSFREDAVLINPSGRLARGRAEIERLFQDEHRGALKGTQFSQRVTDVRQLAPGVALVDQEFTLTGAHDPSGRALPELHVHGAIVLAMQSGKWQVVDGRAYEFTRPPRPQNEGIGSGADDSAGRPPSATERGSAPTTPERGTVPATPGR